MLSKIVRALLKFQESSQIAFKYLNELRLTDKSHFEKKLKIFFDIFHKCNSEFQGEYSSDTLNIKDEYNAILKKVFTFFNESKTTFELTLDHINEKKVEALVIDKWKKEVKKVLRSIISVNIELIRTIRKDSIRIHSTPSKSSKVLKSAIQSKVKTQMKRFLLLVKSIKHTKAMKENIGELKSYIDSISRFLDSNENQRTTTITKCEVQAIDEAQVIKEEVKEELVQESYIEMIEGEMKKEEPTFKLPATFITTRVNATLSIGT
jgi:hypothetical protein